jgi:epoxyqueuosine reductase
VGFDLGGVAPLRPPAASDRFRGWLEAGRHAGMDWLERQRDRILDPARVLPGGKSLLVLGFAHRRDPVEIPGGGRIARYAAGRDYHNVVGRLLRKLARRLAAKGLAGRSRGIVDAGPLLERSHAAEAGLGFESKAANLLHSRFGPWFFLAELLVDEELTPTGPESAGTESVVRGSCGTCRACIDACPTRAIVEPGVVDARLCISYHTIENRGAIPHELRDALGGWLFGCDVCSEVCPWGDPGSEGGDRLGTLRAVEEKTLVEWLRSPPETLAEDLRGSPLQRPKRDGLMRNAALALARHPSDEGREALLGALGGDSSSRVRESAGWSLLRAHGADRGVRPAVEAARDRAPDPDERDGLARSLDELESRPSA